MPYDEGAPGWFHWLKRAGNGIKNGEEQRKHEKERVGHSGTGTTDVSGNPDNTWTLRHSALT